jgi:hypothetical protein
MIALFCLFLSLSVSPFKSKSRLEAENAAPRRRINSVAICTIEAAVYIRHETVEPIVDCCDHCHTSDPERGNPS